MADYTIVFDDGPCLGTERTVTPDELKRGFFTCRGTVYVPYAAGRRGGLIGVETAPANQQRKAGARAYNTAAVAQAWAKFARALSHTAPEQVRRLEHHTARLRRIAR